MGGKPGLKAGNGQAAEWRREEGAFIPSDESNGWKGSMSERAGQGCAAAARLVDVPLFALAKTRLRRDACRLNFQV